MAKWLQGPKKMEEEEKEEEKKPEEETSPPSFSRWLARDEGDAEVIKDVHKEEKTSSPSPARKSLKRKKEKAVVDKGKKIMQPPWVRHLSKCKVLVTLNPLRSILEKKLQNNQNLFWRVDSMKFGSSSGHMLVSGQANGEQEALMIHKKLRTSHPVEPECVKGTEMPDLNLAPPLEAPKNSEKPCKLARRWRPPPNEWLKMNVEGLIWKQKMAMGMVVRDHVGGLLAAVTQTYVQEEHLETASSATLVALLEVLSWAAGCDIVCHRKVVVELKSELVVRYLTDFEAARFQLPDHLSDMREDCLALAAHFQTPQFADVSAQENKVAHWLG